jgi:NAD(P)H-dependent flavin oxidoreductase YrpB (nitropropane dioxygenase family)
VLPIWAASSDTAVQRIRQTQELTAQAFAVNIRADLEQHEHIAAAIDWGVAIIHLFWGNPVPSAKVIPQGIKLMLTVWDEDSAKAALDAGACALIAQGVEAGGHVRGTIRLAELIPIVAAVAGDVPVVAAGGLASAVDIQRALASGASAALLGTRFLVTKESAAHPAYKLAIVDAAEDTTVRTECFDGGWPAAPHRVLRNSTFAVWENAGSPRFPDRPGEGDLVLHTTQGRSVPRYFVSPPAAGMTGEPEAAVMYAGTGVARISDVPSVVELIAGLKAEL